MAYLQVKLQNRKWPLDWAFPKPDWWGSRFDKPDAWNDIATFPSSMGAFFEIGSTSGGCIFGASAGVIPGCAAGYIAGVELHTFITNSIETLFSWAAFGATFQYDNLVDNNRIETGRIVIGERTATGLVTTIPGTINVSSGIFDAGIDV